jgi:hypothetical protein
LEIALEPMDMQELVGEPTLCHLLLGSTGPLEDDLDQ